MNSERELFLYELDGRGYHFRNTNWIDKLERFDDWQLNMAWEMWCASAQRQGYKLVPVEPTKNMMIASSGYSHAHLIYKAMIGAVDEK